jgi:predicted MFS family arabinose efflux permease
LGLFCGGTLGGWLYEHIGAFAVFALGAGLSVAWLIIAASMKNLPRRGVVPAVA